jgi:phosphopentomutase
MAGIVLEKPFSLFPKGFPAPLLREFEQRTGRGTLGNKPASGTEIIKELGEEHQRTGRLIVYTSADSVFQIAAHEQTVPIEEQYRICEIARGLLRGEWEVGRVIARPFTGTPGAYTRTANRHDYAVPPPEGMLLDRLSEAGVPVHSIGKIADIFLSRGVTASAKTSSNAEGMAQTLAAAREVDRGLIWVNLVDFDMLYGHRNDVEGYARALEAVDAWIPELLGKLGARELLILTADHGCDPTTPSTDHSREYVPLLAYGPSAARGAALGARASLADVAQTVAENFGTSVEHGRSFLPLLTGRNSRPL